MVLPNFQLQERKTLQKQSSGFTAAPRRPFCRIDPSRKDKWLRIPETFFQSGTVLWRGNTTFKLWLLLEMFLGKFPSPSILILGLDDQEREEESLHIRRRLCRSKPLKTKPARKANKQKNRSDTQLCFCTSEVIPNCAPVYSLNVPSHYCISLQSSNYLDIVDYSKLDANSLLLIFGRYIV